MNPKQKTTFLILIISTSFLIFLSPFTSATVFSNDATSLTAVVGTVANGTIADLNSTDPDVIQINEVSGATGIDLRFNFSNVPLIYGLQFYVRAMYNGNPAHHIAVQIYNYTANTWITEATIDNSALYIWTNMTIPATNYLDFVKNGNITLRMFHLQNGVSTHRLYLDTLVMNMTQDYPPGFTNIMVSSKYAGSLCMFSGYASDPAPDGDLQYWILETNNTGVASNSSNYNFASGLGGWMNTTLILNSLVGSVVAYKYYAFCTDGDYAVSSERYLTILAALPYPSPPHATFVWNPTAPYINETVTFTSTSITLLGITNYIWDFGDGNITSGNYSSITHTYILNGTYNISINVTSLGGSDKVTVPITIYPLPVIDETGVAVAVIFGVLAAAIAIIAPLIYKQQKQKYH